MKIQHRHINVIQQLRVILHRITAREENDNFFLEILLQESEEKEEAMFGRAYNVALGECCDCTGGFFLVNVNVYRTGTKRYSCEVRDFCGLCCREEH